MSVTNNQTTPATNWLDDASDFHEGKALVRKGDAIFYINQDGEDAFPSLCFENADKFSDGYAWVVLEGKKVVIDHSGAIKASAKTIEECIFFSEGRALVRYENEEKWLCIDKELNELFSLEGYKPVSQFKEGFAIVKREKVEAKYKPLSDEEIEKRKELEDSFEEYYSPEDFGVNEQDENPKITPEELRVEAEFVPESYEPVYEYNFINKEGKLLSEEWYDIAEPFSEDFAVVGTHLNLDYYAYNYIDVQGKKLSKQSFAEAFDFSEGLGAVALDKDFDGLSFSYCYIDKNGQLVMPHELNIIKGSIAESLRARYNKAYPFEEGIACIGWQFADGMDGHFIDHSGKVLYSFMFDSEYMLFGYKEGFAGFAVVEGIELTRQYYINRQGINVFGKFFDEIRPFSEGYAIVKVEGKYNYINRNGEYLI